MSLQHCFPAPSIRAASSSSGGVASATKANPRKFALTFDRDAAWDADGFTRPALLMNGQMPGPTLTANAGDWVEITVKNDLPEETSVHWHGFMQRGTKCTRKEGRALDGGPARRAPHGGGWRRAVPRLLCAPSQRPQLEI